jgi:4-amino-4-deoxy-L-arabinose transferase and related glycosyltransferases of PMT family
MKKIKLTKETIALTLITLLSAALNFVNLNIEGTANSYYAAAVKSMTLSFKNFFFVSFDPAGFVTIDKPPLGYWFQAISAKIFGYSGWSILLPQALAGVISVVLIYKIVKRSFGSIAGLISALCLTVTPVFVAASRNNTVDNVLILALLLACWALSAAAEKGKFTYLILSMVLVGVGFNIKQLQAYMIIPAIYITYLLTSATTFKKRIIHLAAGTVVLIAVSLSWALIVDSIPASSRPYIDSSTNNTVMELIIGHNGIERLSLGGSTSNGGGMGGGMRDDGQQPSRQDDGSFNPSSGTTQNQNGTSNQVQGQQLSAPDGTQNQGGQGFPGGPQDGNNQGMPGNPPADGFRGNDGTRGGDGGSGGLQGTFGGQVKAGLARLFSKNILSDQIVWFIVLAVFGFIAAAIKEKLTFRLDSKKKQSLVLWFMWFLPEFIYFSFNTGTFHSYYLTMLAPPIAALTGIGITSMWELYKEGGWKSWFLPVSLLANGLVQLMMLNYFINSSGIVKVLIVLLIVLCIGSSITLSVLNLIKRNDTGVENTRQYKSHKLGKALVALSLAGLLVTPAVGSAAAMFYKLNGSFPAAGLELLSGSQGQMSMMGSASNGDGMNSSSSGLIQFLEKNKTANQKYLLVVSNSNSAADIIINTGEAVMSLGGFLGNNKPLTLDQFIELVKKGEVRYVMAGGGGQGGSSNSEIMNWVQENGQVVSASEYSNSTVSSSNNANTQSQDFNRFNGIGNSGQLYDLKAYTDSSAAK